MKSRVISLFFCLAAAPCLNASIFVQELFDGISVANASLDGAGDTATSVGMTGVWTTYGSTGISTAGNFNVDGALLPGLPSNNGANGGVWNATASWNSNIYAVRPLTQAIDFNADREIYFSVRLNNAGDTGMGIGLSTGGAPEDQFVGAGFSWNNARPMATGLNEAGNAAYISYGTLNNATETVNGTPSVIVDGVYGIRAVEPAGSVNGFGLLVGRITLRSSGEDTIQIRRYAENEIIDSDLDAISWTVTSSVNSSMLATHLLLWMNGNGLGELDAIRFGETWTDVTGVELAGPEQPVLMGSSITEVTNANAVASVNLFTSAADVTLFWDIEDQGVGAWSNSNFLGPQAIGPVSGAISGLSPDRRYYYRFYAVNTTPNPDLEAWSEGARSFVTSPAGIAVTDLSTRPFSALEMDLLWTDIFETETGYTIQRSPGGANQWETIGTVGANADFFTDKYSGLVEGATYDYRIFATNAAGNSDFSNVASGTIENVEPLKTQLLVNFDGTFSEGQYTFAEGEVDLTGTFRVSGEPTIQNGMATINPGNEGGIDGFDIDSETLGDLAVQNWVAEMIISYQSPGEAGDTTPVLIDILGDCNLRLRSQDAADVLQLFYYNGSSARREFAAMPPTGTPVHLGLSWDASTATLTGYINGISFGSIANGPFAKPSSVVSFGYFARGGFIGRGVDGVVDAIAFQTGTAAFRPASDFLLILPDRQDYASWIGGFSLGGRDLFDDDADSDGIPNGVEAFLGTNPGSPNAGLSPVSTNGTVSTFNHPVTAQSLSDVTGSYEWSLDLVNWYPGDSATGPAGGPTVGISSQTSGSTATVTVTSSTAVSKIFVRIVATRSGN